MEGMSTVVERRASGAGRWGGLVELIAVPVRAAVLTDGPGVGGEFVVSHSESGLTRGLELDEQVVVVDPDGEFHAASVVDVEFSLEDTHYVLELGVRLPPDTVRERLSGVDTGAPAGDDLGALLDLLGRLRDRPEPS